MIERFGRAKVWPWLALVVVLGVVGAFAADAIVDGKRLLDFPGRGALIAAFDQVQEVSNADPPARSSREAEKGTSFAKQLSAAFHNAAEKVLPCVVTIVNTPPAPSEKNEAAEDDDNGGFNPWEGTPFGDLFRFKGKPLPPHGMGISSGSGVIIDPSGIILTNGHVVEGDGTVMVRLADGREFRANGRQNGPQERLGRPSHREGGQFEGRPLRRQRSHGRRRLGPRPGTAVRTGRDRHGGHHQRQGARSSIRLSGRTSCRPTRPSIPATAAGRW